MIHSVFFVYPSSNSLDMSIELEVTPEARGHWGLGRETVPYRRMGEHRCYEGRNRGNGVRNLGGKGEGGCLREEDSERRDK